VKKTNDFDVKVQVIYAEPGSQWTRVGLQARNNLNVGESPADRNLATGGSASAYAQTHVNPNQTLASSGRFGNYIDPAPFGQPTLTAIPTGGTVADGVYNVKVTYAVANSKESLPSALSTVDTSGSGGTSTITITSPIASPGVTGWYAYVTQDAGTRYFRQQPAGAPTAIGTDFVLTATPTTNGAALVLPMNPTPNNGHEQNRRATMGGQSDGWGSPSTSPVYPNVWLRLQRSGTNLHGFRSEDGVIWTDQGTTVLTDQQPDMFVGPFAAVETGNIWAGADFNVYNDPFNPAYDRLMVYQFRNFGNTFPPSVSISGSAGTLTITFTGSLLSAPALTGPWTPVAGATSPYSTSATGAARFFRALGDFP
jgi:hypothetical protein